MCLLSVSERLCNAQSSMYAAIILATMSESDVAVNFDQYYCALN